MNCEALTSSGLAAHQAGHWQTAAELCEQALAHAPQHAPALHLAGLLQHQLGHSGVAVDKIQASIALQPGCAAAHNDLGIALKALGRLPEAVESFRQALALSPGFADAHFNLGNALKELGNLPDAVTCFVRADALKPGLPDVATNCGAALRDLNRCDEAAWCYAEALRREPDFPEAHWNRGVLRLLSGEYEGGWRDYEWRWRVPGLLPPKREFAEPEWTGGDLRGRRILLHAEQGFGDTLQFARYAPLLAQRGAEVFFQVQPPLVSLLRSLRGVKDVLSERDRWPEVDFQSPLMSLPRWCGTKLENIPAEVPYLHATPGLVSVPPAAPGRPLRVGFGWAGNPANGADRQRSMRFADLLPLFTDTRATFYSLQCGPRALELCGLPEGLPVHDLSPQLHDFAATASAIAELDLVITVDTSVAHLAGALGRPVWTLLSFTACWRWLRDRADSPWYPTMRLFRQSTVGDWRPVIDAVKREL